MDRVTGEVRSPGGITNAGQVFVINHNADNALVTLRYRLKDVEMEAAEEPLKRLDASSIAARSLFAKAMATIYDESQTNWHPGLCRCGCAVSKDPSGPSGANRDDAYMAKHAG